MAEGATIVANDLARELVIERTFDAPRELVFRALTDPKQMARWWGPPGFTATDLQQELRPGGVWRLCLRRIDGSENLWLGGKYREISAPQHLVFTFAWDEGNGLPSCETLVTIEFIEHGNKTIMKLRQTPFDSVEQREGHRDGWSSSLDRLDKQLSLIIDGNDVVDDSTTKLIDESVMALESASAALLKTFEFVPDERLKWAPSPTARTPLWIVAHCGATNLAAVTLLKGELLPISNDPAEASEQIRAGGRDVATRVAAIELVTSSTLALIEVLQTVTPDQLKSSVEMPFGSMPYSFWVTFPAAHMDGHRQQVDYLQTCWGDFKDHQL